MTQTTARQNPAPAVINVSEATFDQDVVERSYTTPVVIDFWAPWCGPCRTLGPTLEKLANESRGSWTLAKVNVDQNPRLAQAFGVQGIPAVKAVREGRLVEEFTGALPESQVREWLKGIVSTAAAIIEEDLDAMEQSNPQEAANRYRAAIAQDGANAEPRLKLGRMLLLAGEREGAEVLRGTPENSPLYSTAQAMLPLADMLTEHPAATEGSAKRYAEAAAFVRQRHYREAMDTLLAIVARDRGFREDGARKALIALFAVLGDEEPLVGEYRRKLSNLLF